MKSHVQISKCVLKHFVNEKKEFFCYSIKDDKISILHPKSTGIIEDYYSEKMENKLSKNLEKKLPLLLEFSEKLINSHQEVVINSEIEELAYLYIKSLVSRNIKFHDDIINNNKYSFLFSTQNLHDIIVDISMSSNFDFFNNTFVTFIVNKTKIPFILPYKGLYEMSFSNNISLCAPINSYCALVISKKGNDYNSVKKIYVVENCYTSVINKMNRCSIKVQIKENNGYLICCNKEILENSIKNWEKKGNERY